MLESRDIRIFVLMKEKISSFEKSSHDPALPIQLTSDLEGLVSNLNQVDPSWIEEFRGQWWQLELTIALLADEDRKILSLEDLTAIESALKKMLLLIKSQLSIEGIGTENEQPAPWIKYPGYPPYDCFWRQSGEAWLGYVWEPYWNSLSTEEKENYLNRWDAPDEWRFFSGYINPEFAKWLESIDDEN